MADFAPGPFGDVDLTDPRPPYAPIFLPIAEGLIASFGPLHGLLDLAYATLFVEFLLDVGGVLDAGLGELAANHPVASLAVDQSDLVAAAATYATLPSAVATLRASLPPDATDVLLTKIDLHPPSPSRWPHGPIQPLGGPPTPTPSPAPTPTPTPTPEPPPIIIINPPGRIHPNPEPTPPPAPTPEPPPGRIPLPVPPVPPVHEPEPEPTPPPVLPPLPEPPAPPVYPPERPRDPDRGRN